MSQTTTTMMVMTRIRFQCQIYQLMLVLKNIIMTSMACMEMLIKRIASEGKGSARTAKHESDTREPHSRGNSKHGGDKSRQMTKRSTSHSRSSRSRSPRGRSRTRNETSSHVRGSVSRDEPSDSVKKRKHHSCKNSISPSPPKSRNRLCEIDMSVQVSSREETSGRGGRDQELQSKENRRQWARPGARASP